MTWRCLRLLIFEGCTRKLAVAPESSTASKGVSAWIVLPAGIFLFRAGEGSAALSVWAGGVVVGGVTRICQSKMSSSDRLTGAGDGECAAGGLGGVGAKLAAASGVRAGLSEMLAAEVGARGSAAGLWWLADAVGMATWIGVASVSSIFRMYSFLVQSDRSAVNLSDGRLGTAPRRHKAEIMQGKAKMPLDDGIDQHQPSSVHCLIVGSGHDIALYKSVPEFGLGQEVWAADGFGIFAFNIPLGALLAQLILDCVKVFILKDVNKLIDVGAVVRYVQYAVYCGGVGRHFPASHCYCVLASSVVSVEFHHPIHISSGWLSSKAEPAEVEQPPVDYVLQAITLQAVVKEKPLFFPSIFGSNYFVMAFSNGCTAKLGRHAFDG
ncbi:hypothetical protein V6N13_059571 [Hibiscus sabdariffa]